MDCPVGTVRSRIFRAREFVDYRILDLLDKIAKLLNLSMSLVLILDFLAGFLKAILKLRTLNE